MQVVLVGFDGMDREVSDDPLLVELLAARGVVAQRWSWTDPSLDWTRPDLVFLRTTWDYTQQVARFLAFVADLPGRVENDPALVCWNADKHYMRDLSDAGLPTVPTTYLAAGDPVDWPAAEVVVKPTVSAGARDTGRFGAHARDSAEALVRHITSAGRVAMVQPFVSSVATTGETAVVMVDGELSHVLRKRSVLQPDQVAPLQFEGGSAAAMYDPDLVRAGTAADDEIDLARAVVAYVTQRFATVPLQLRVDMVRGPDGAPVVLEVEAVEPHLYLGEAPGAAERLADAVVRRLPR